MKWFKREKDEQEAWRKEYVATDFGRRYGWWVCLDGERVAELNYRTWDSHSQFWHVYHLTPCHPRFSEIKFDPDLWCMDNVSLQSRYAPELTNDCVLMAPSKDQHVAIRSIHLPEDVFQRAMLRNTTLENYWLRSCEFP